MIYYDDPLIVGALNGVVHKLFQAGKRFVPVQLVCNQWTGEVEPRIYQAIPVDGTYLVACGLYAIIFKEDEVVSQ